VTKTTGFSSKDLLEPWSQILLITLKYRANADLHTFQSQLHTLGFPVFTTRLLATDLNTETSTSNHYEVFLPFCLQSLWNLGIKKFFWTDSYRLRLTRNCPWTNSVTAFTSLTSTLHRLHGKHGLYFCWRHCLRGSVFTEPLLRNVLHNSVVLPLLGADDIENTTSYVLHRVYRAVTWKRVGQIRTILLVSCARLHICRMT
jgi:hypothetical protein